MLFCMYMILILDVCPLIDCFYSRCDHHFEAIPSLWKVIISHFSAHSPCAHLRSPFVLTVHKALFVRSFIVQSLFIHFHLEGSVFESYNKMRKERVRKGRRKLTFQRLHFNLNLKYTLLSKSVNTKKEFLVFYDNNYHCIFF